MRGCIMLFQVLCLVLSQQSCLTLAFHWQGGFGGNTVTTNTNTNIHNSIHNSVPHQRHAQRQSSPFTAAFSTTTTTTRTQLFARKGGKRNGGGGGGGNSNNAPSGRLVSETLYIKLEDDGTDAWRTMDVVDLLNRGGVGIVPTDTGYGLITTMDSKSGLERILRIKQHDTNNSGKSRKKPLSVLCCDLPTIDSFCYGIDRSVFKILKKNLPGPYTFILPASTTLPKGMILNSSGGSKTWARSTVGIRMPQDPVLRYLQDDLLDKMPLLVSSIPKRLMNGGDFNDDDEFDDDDDDDDDGVSPFSQCTLDPSSSWYNQVDFIVDAGPRPLDGSTIYDLTARGEPELIREGIGETVLEV